MYLALIYISSMHSDRHLYTHSFALRIRTHTRVLTCFSSYSVKRITFNKCVKKKCIHADEASRGIILIQFLSFAGSHAISIF